MSKNKKRVIFFAETVTLAHIARCVVIAKALHETGRYSVALAADQRFDAIIGDLPFMRFPLTSISCEQFSQQLRKGDPVYDVDTLTEYVENDLLIIEQFKPDFIIGDFRLSLSISSQLAKIPYANITNAYWSPYADISYPIPEILLTKIMGVNIAQKIFNVVRPVIFKLHSFAFNKVCKKFQLPTLAYDMREIYTHADYSLYADIESFVPMKPYPDNHYFIGPILWSADVAYPAWWDSLPADKPIIYVTMGSSGDSDLLPMIIKALSEMPVTVICVTANKTKLESHYSNIFITPFIPAEYAVKKSDIVICNGGSPMVYQCIVENKYFIGLPSNLDQYLIMNIAHSAGYGEMIRSGKADSQLITDAVTLGLSKSHKTNSFSGTSLDIEKIELLINKV